jgi:hypothetical protein
MKGEEEGGAARSLEIGGKSKEETDGVEGGKGSKLKREREGVGKRVLSREGERYGKTEAMIPGERNDTRRTEFGGGQWWEKGKDDRPRRGGRVVERRKSEGNGRRERSCPERRARIDAGTVVGDGSR